MSEGGQYSTDVIKLKIPILGGILSKTSIARFTRTLGTLISAGVPILDAINITKETSGNEVYARALQKVHDAIREGESMADPLRQTKVCDAIVVNMIDVGEETGDLDKMLLKVADNYDADVDVLVASLISILEPVMVVDPRRDRRLHRHRPVHADDHADRRHHQQADRQVSRARRESLGRRIVT